MAHHVAGDSSDPTSRCQTPGWLTKTSFLTSKGGRRREGGGRHKISRSKAQVVTMSLLLADHLSPTITVFSIAALILSLWFFSGIIRDRRKYKYHPTVGTIFHVVWNYRRMHDYLTDLSRCYKTFRLFSPTANLIFTVDPANVEHILKTNFDNYGKGWYSYDGLSDFLGDGIFTVDGDKWRQQRKLASFEFSTRVLRDSSGVIFKANAAKLAHVISKSASTNSPIDLQDLFMKSTMDSIFKIAIDVDVNSLQEEDGQFKKFAKATDEANMLVTYRYTDFFWKIKRLFHIGSEARLKENILTVDSFIYGTIRTKANDLRKKNNVKKEDILSRFLLQSREDPENTNHHKYLRDIILSFIGAGKDTTAGTLSWFFLMLCLHPHVKEKVVQEIGEATHFISVSDNFSEFASNITDDVLEKMQYLHAAISETLRLYPVLPLNGKVCFSDDTLPDGFNLRKGDIIHYQSYPMGRMKFLWGEDAEVFRPERWLDENGTFRPESSFKFTSFQAGPRICIGKDFAYRQMKIFSTVLLRFFEFELCDKNKEIKYSSRLVLQIDQGLHVYASYR